VSGILEDPEAMEAVELLRSRGYSPDQVVAMLTSAFRLTATVGRSLTQVAEAMASAAEAFDRVNLSLLSATNPVGLGVEIPADVVEGIVNRVADTFGHRTLQIEALYLIVSAGKTDPVEAERVLVQANELAEDDDCLGLDAAALAVIRREASQ